MFGRVTFIHNGTPNTLMSFRKKRPKLIDDFPISNSAFMYIHNRRNSTREPLYETLDRILEQHERLTSEKIELDEEEKEDLK